MAESFAGPGVVKEIGEIERSIAYLVQNLPTHDAFLNHYCPATPSSAAAALTG
ncbi:hypothetical protein [Brevundimonas sp. TWP2-3-4b1]|uniref:hypothetical protein n=1 Tax=Brevundimonas sp. TWP2-3-4b1 TaxID=2804580 RepID=UPI003CE72FAC